MTLPAARRWNARRVWRIENGILDNPAVNAFVATVSEEDLQTWATYEKARKILQTFTLDFPLKRR